jgi:hypothetical protein
MRALTALGFRDGGGAIAALVAIDGEELPKNTPTVLALLLA